MGSQRAKEQSCPGALPRRNALAYKRKALPRFSEVLTLQCEVAVCNHTQRRVSLSSIFRNRGSWSRAQARRGVVCDIGVTKKPFRCFGGRRMDGGRRTTWLHFSGSLWGKNSNVYHS